MFVLNIVSQTLSRFIHTPGRDQNRKTDRGERNKTPSASLRSAPSFSTQSFQ